MTKQLIARCQRDQDAAAHANDQARILQRQDQRNQPKRCGSCGAPAPDHLEEGQGLPCGH